LLAAWIAVATAAGHVIPVKIPKSIFNRYKETQKAPIAIIECLLMIGGYWPFILTS
jgi:hypothetical protein